MPKGRVLTPAEREEIVSMHEAGASGREIAKKIARSKTVVLSFLKNPAQYAQIKRSGRKRALSGDDEQRLYAALFQQRSSSSAHGDSECAHGDGAAQGYTQAPDAESATMTTHERAATVPVQVQHMKMSAEQIKKEFNVPLSTRRIQQMLSEWRREAQRVQARLQIAQIQQSAADAEESNATATIADITATTGGGSVEHIDTTGQPVDHEGGSTTAADDETTLDQSLYEAASEPLPAAHQTVNDNANAPVEL